MPKVNWTGHELITGFTDFYQEVTLIKEAIALGRLPCCWVRPTPIPPPI